MSVVSTGNSSPSEANFPEKGCRHRCLFHRPRWSQAGRAAKDAPHLYLLVCEVEVTRSTFFLEHRAVLEGMHAWCQIPEHDGMMATVIVDNAAFTFAFAFALRHVFSSTAKAWGGG